MGSKLTAAAIGGLVGLVIVAIVLIARAALIEAEDGDWLSFAGAVTGTALAVGGAVWIEHWKRRTERQAEAKAILAAVIRLRSIAETMLKDRPDDYCEADWQEAINQMPENLATYTTRLDRALDRLTTATDDFDVVETGDMVLRAARRLGNRFASGDADQTPHVIASLDLLRNCCDVAVPMLTSRLNSGRALTFAEAIEGRGQKLN